MIIGNYGDNVNRANVFVGYGDIVPTYNLLGITFHQLKYNTEIGTKIDLSKVETVAKLNVAMTYQEAIYILRDIDDSNLFIVDKVRVYYTKESIPFVKNWLNEFIKTSYVLAAC